MNCIKCSNEIDYNENIYARGSKPSICAKCKKARYLEYQKQYYFKHRKT
jgi:hypothetical protein